jgi:hypothetical protein
MIASTLQWKHGPRAPGDPDIPLLLSAGQQISTPSGKSCVFLFTSIISFSAPSLFS